MISLDELLRTVEPAALRSETTQRHLARLHAAQASSTHTSADHLVQAYPAAEDRPVPAGSMGGVDPTSRGRGRRSLIMAVLAAAAVVAVVAVSWSSLARPVVQVPA